MAKVTFIADFVFVPPEDRRVAVKYLAGKSYDGVRQVALQMALAAGAVAADPLDHDGDGRKGGSRPRERRSPPRLAVERRRFAADEIFQPSAIAAAAADGED